MTKCVILLHECKVCYRTYYAPFDIIDDSDKKVVERYFNSSSLDDRLGIKGHTCNSCVRKQKREQENTKLDVFGIKI